MAEEPTDVPVVTEQTPAPSAEVTQEVTSPETASPEAQEPVDERGVPLKNREAELQRKAQKAAATQSLLTPQQSGQPAAQNLDTNELVQAMQQIARQSVETEIAPLIAEQFLTRHADAAEMIDDINRIRAEHPEIGGIRQLELAYKIAKADREDAHRLTNAQKQREEEETSQTKARQSSVEGGGRVTPPPANIDESMKSAKTLAELNAAVAHLKR